MKFAGLLSLILASTVFATPSPRAEQGQLIHFNHSNKCLTVKNSVFAAGTPVQLNDCNGAKSQRWIIQKGSTKVRVANTDFCLDNGAVLSNGAVPTISKCRDDIAMQKWYYDKDRIELQGRGLCLDRGNLIAPSTSRVQTWICSYTDSNQVWTL